MNRNTQSNRTGQVQGHRPDDASASPGQVVGKWLLHSRVRGVAILVVCVAFAQGTGLTTWGGSPGQISPVGPEAFDAFRDFVTGKTAVEYALVEFMLNPLEANRLFAFAYDSHTFYAREYCTNNHDLNGLCMRDKLCGRKDGYYWFYNGDERNPLLYTSFSPEDTTAGAYGGVESYFNIFAGMFQTYGLSDQGLNSLVFRNRHFEVENPARIFSMNAQIQLDPQGFVSSVEHTIAGMHNGQGYLDKDKLLFYYDTTTKRTHGLPTFARMENRNFQIRIVELRPLATAKRLEEPSFVPLSLFSSTNINRVIHSNKTDYFLLPDGCLSSMDGRIVDQEMADLRAGRRFFYVGMATLIALSLVLFRIQSSRTREVMK